MSKCLEINRVPYYHVSKKTSLWKLKQDFESNANKNLSYQHPEDAATTIPRGGFTALNKCLKKE